MSVRKDAPLHTGHRGRMKDKFERYGERFFETYEILEMLLYYVLPQKDTKPIAKTLLLKFGSLEGIFSASVDELCCVSGVGQRCAEFLLTVGCIRDVRTVFASDGCESDFSNYRRTGEYFRDYFAENGDTDVLYLLLDGNMRCLVKRGLSCSFGSAGIKPEAFIRPAVETGAEMAIIGYKHNFGPLFPTESERETGKMIATELSRIGVTLVEQFVVAGSDYLGVGTELKLKFGSDSKLGEFLESKGREVGDEER